MCIYCPVCENVCFQINLNLNWCIYLLLMAVACTITTAVCLSLAYGWARLSGKLLFVEYVIVFRSYILEHCAHCILCCCFQQWCQWRHARKIFRLNTSFHYILQLSMQLTIMVSSVWYCIHKPILPLKCLTQ